MNNLSSVQTGNLTGDGKRIYYTYNTKTMELTYAVDVLAKSVGIGALQYTTKFIHPSLLDAFLVAQVGTFAKEVII